MYKQSFLNTGFQSCL